MNYSVEFRVRCGNREFCDPFEALTLNGPDSDSQEAVAHRYHLRFNADSGSTYERCIENLEKFVIEIGEPWFNAIKHDSPPTGCPEETVLASRKLLGMKEQKL